MPDYRKMYYVLFNTITDTVDIMEHYCLDDNLQKALEKLKEAQKKCEEMYIEE